VALYGDEPIISNENLRMKLTITMILTLQCKHKGNNAHSLRNPVIDEAKPMADVSASCFIQYFNTGVSVAGRKSS